MNLFIAGALKKVMRGDGRPFSTDELLPARALGEDLRALSRRDHIDARHVDAVILGAATHHFVRARSQESPWRIRRWASVAAAASLLLTALLAMQFGLPRAGSPALAHDVNRDRQVDILDAFALARRIERGAHLSTSIDLDGDGQLTQRDVDALASRAVALEETAGAGAHAAAKSHRRPQS